MTADSRQPTSELEPHWADFEGLLAELARIAKSDLPFDDLSRALLEETIHLMAAVGGAVWLSAGSDRLRLECQLHHDVLDNAPGQDFHHQLLEQARQEGEIIAVPPGGTAIGSKILPNPTQFTLLLGPLKAEQDVIGVFEIIQRPTTSAAALRGNRRLLGLVCELAADQLRRQETRQLRDQNLRTQQFEHFTEQIHATINLREVAYHIVNAGRQYIGCDRVSVAVRRGRRFELLAISGVDSPDRRSNAIRQLEELAVRVGNSGETIWYDDGGNEEIAPQIVEKLKQFADDLHPRTIGLVPLNAPRLEEDQGRPHAIGVFIVEQFTSVLDGVARERAVRVARHSGGALANGLRYESLPALPFARWWHRELGQPAVRTSRIVLTLAAAAAVAAALFIPIDFNVHAQGDLQPDIQQHVFAPFDGQVATILVNHGERVTKDQVLLELRSTDLDLETQRIQGEFDVTQKRIAAIDSSLLQIDDADDQSMSRADQLAAEQEELRQLLASQQGQLAILRGQREKLTLRSPIDGEVLTWDLEQTLSDRPVQRGQLLLSVGDLDGPWVADLEVPDDDIGYVLDARTDGSRAPVSFELATHRGVDYHGQIRRIATRTETPVGDRPVVRVTLDVDEEKLGHRRPGATIFAKIHCGKMPAAYVWFHDVVEAVKSWLSF